jgi:hypothetical protein
MKNSRCAGAAFYLVLADGKHKSVSDTVKGGENARKITIKYENQNHQLKLVVLITLKLSC